MPDSALSTGQATARDMLGALPLVSKRNYQPTLGCQVNFETLLYLRSCQRAKRQNSCCSWGGLCKPMATRANSAPPNGWRSAFLLAPTRSLGPRRRSRTFKRRPVAPRRKPSRRLRDKGHEVIARDPFEALVRAVDSLDPQAQTAMREALHRVLTTLAASGTHQHFGACRDCAHLSGEINADSMGASRSIPECLLFGAPIEPDDAVLLCVHFQPKGERREEGSPRRSAKRTPD